MRTDPDLSTEDGPAFTGRRLRILLLAIVSTVALLGAACSSGSDDSSDGAGDGSESAGEPADDDGLSNCGDVPDLDSSAINQGATVNLVDFEFCQQEVTIEVGQAVTWTNLGAARHTATDDTSAERLFVSDPILQGEDFVWSFDEPGTYTYICTFHPDLMGGTIIVQ